MKKVILAVSCALAFASVLPLFAAGEDETVRRIQARFVSPCCWHENLAVHDSPVAREMRAEVASLVVSGKTETEIVDYYVARYGEQILRVPRGAPFHFLMVTPFLALALGGALVIRYLTRARRSVQTDAGGLTLPSLPDEFE
jgi:cytochrome c-type biogenesis protein CcmH